MRTKGISTLDPKKYPHEYYSISIVSKATGLSPSHLRRSGLQRYRFGNTDFLKTMQVNRYIEDPGRTNGVAVVVPKPEFTESA